jgi:hypothetical protein
MMVSGVLAHKAKKPAQADARHFPMLDIGQSRLKAPSFTSFGRFFFGRVSCAGLE